MLRVNASALTQKAGKTYCLDATFNGIAFSTAEDGRVTQATRYLHGVVIDDYQPIPEYRNNRLTIDEATSKIDAACLVSGADSYTGEPYYYKDELFTGIAYRFEGVFCTDEVIYLNGYYSSMEIGSSWYKSGTLKSVDLDQGNFSESYSWYEDGTLENVVITHAHLDNIRTHFGLELGFNKAQQLKSLLVKGDYFNRVFDIWDDIKFHLFTCRCEAIKFRGAPYLYITGSGIEEL